MRISTPEQAEEYFGIEFTSSQYMDILNYFHTGVIPDPDGCTSCDRAFVREMIGNIEAVNKLDESGY